MSSLKAKDKSEPVAYSEAALRNNAVVVEYCRTSMAALSGSTAGVLGLTGIYGFAFYVFAVVILWVMFMLKSGSNWSKYYVSRQSLLTNGFLRLYLPMYYSGHLYMGWCMYIS
ncbi:ER membrane protein complex subunit 6-like [Manduca sexta]|uniref:ER membrane protein complex subunit 6-like n=1 Tax=Manduca sexta TaxID=7130 RepID=UPI00188EB2FF|nr:ER membrane protein complex subunit 6-like [Manduca sexta]